MMEFFKALKCCKCNEIVGFIPPTFNLKHDVFKEYVCTKCKPINRMRIACPFHYKPNNEFTGNAYCLIGDCMYDDEKKCPIFQKHTAIIQDLQGR